MKEIIGPFLLEVSSLEVDCEQAGDLTVLQNKARTIACRVRRHGFAERFPDQFTIRSMRDSGARTEFEKIYFDGWADWMFYGHQAALDSLQIYLWWIINLNAWRTALKHDSHLRSNGGQSGLRYHEINNGDGTRFMAFEIKSFPKEPPLVIAQSHPVDDHAVSF